MYRLLFILALNLYTVHSCEVCEPCECNVIKFHRRFLCTANCSSRGLTSIPGTLPSEIEVIDLSYNDIHSEDLERLKLFTEYLADLNLSYNNITYLPPRSLSTASQLNVLNLDGNVLEKVDSTSFGHLKQLHKLIGIHAKTFEENTFDNLEGLNDMSIVFGSKEVMTVMIDGVKSLPRNLFDKQQSLKHLSLNNIEDLILPKSESQVDTLDLSGSTLYRISADWFIGFKNLRFLNLSRTKLIEVNNDTLMSLLSLTVLDLSYNNITNLPDALFKSSQNTIVAFNVSRLFRNARSLRRLDISGNKIQTLPHDFFETIRFLEFVSLDDNPVHCDCPLMLIRDSMPRLNLIGKSNHLHPSIVQIFNRDTPEQAIGNDFYDTFLGTSAFYIAIGCVAAVFLGALVGVAVVMARRKLRSRAYEVSETTEIPNDDIAMALRHVHEEDETLHL
ncbi:leucine-rich repeat and immunoglobulin-like domain-containing nogo receptor-interacting protein 3 [Mytilus californianus]|uniref:leucine-rich repeat and immunoglobulin-like domain-containing nogo receptor-interacting protein 3 n=1 Tax=Mytilus californianus TaxID=6549 RepID=UPI002245A5CA|nr:leucine-rich repeat and immunoglobulin-like domain-containing nogo receptor-interacting protein 3 [Mytilus californianus]